MEAIHSSDDEYVHVIDLEKLGLKLDYKHCSIIIYELSLNNRNYLKIYAT